MPVLEYWVAELREGTKQDRRKAAQALSGFGDAAVEPLAWGLLDEDLDVRAEVARALEVVGDERAVGPLRAALRSHFLGKSPRWHRYAPLLLALPAIPILIVWATSSSRVFATIQVIVQIPTLFAVHYYLGKSHREQRSRSLRALIDALAAIATRKPVPELSHVVEDLRVASRDRIQHSTDTREAARLAAEQIEALTAELRSLPVAAAGPGATPDVLPRPAEASLPRADTLPRVQA